MCFILGDDRESSFLFYFVVYKSLSIVAVNLMTLALFVAFFQKPLNTKQWRLYETYIHMNINSYC